MSYKATKPGLVFFSDAATAEEWHVDSRVCFEHVPRHRHALAMHPRGTWGAFDGVNAACSVTYNARKIRTRRCARVDLDDLIHRESWLQYRHENALNDNLQSVNEGPVFFFVLYRPGFTTIRHGCFSALCWAVPASALFDQYQTELTTALLK